MLLFECFLLLLIVFQPEDKKINNVSIQKHTEGRVEGYIRPLSDRFKKDVYSFWIKDLKVKAEPLVKFSGKVYIGPQKVLC